MENNRRRQCFARTETHNIYGAFVTNTTCVDDPTKTGEASSKSFYTARNDAIHEVCDGCPAFTGIPNEVATSVAVTNPPDHACATEKSQET